MKISPWLFGVILILGSAMQNPAEAQAPSAPAASAASKAGPSGTTGTSRRGRAPFMMRDPYAGMKKLLVWADVQSGFQHDSINHAMAVIEEVGRKSGVYVSFLRTDSQLVTNGKITASSKRYQNRFINAHNLKYFDAIYFLGSGEGTLTKQQKADLLSFVRDDGKGLIVGHAATIAFYNWPEWGKMIGGFMQDREYPATGMWCTTVDMNWPAAAAFGKRFFWKDQFPQLQPQFVPGEVHTIIALDTSKMTPEQRAKRKDNYFPVVWAKHYGKGRVFSIAAGHNDATYDDPKMQGLILEAVKWVTRLDNTPAPLDPKQ